MESKVFRDPFKAWESPNNGNLWIEAVAEAGTIFEDKQDLTTTPCPLMLDVTVTNLL